MPNRPVAVIKLGSNALLDAAGRLDLAFLDRVAGQLAAVVAGGWRPVLVSSGAVASGRGLVDAPRTGCLGERQALAAIGQATLMHRWQVALAGHGLIGAQVLLTGTDFELRERYLNLTATFRSLFMLAAVPIVNENDTVSVEELTFGDNDRLSALVASQLGAHKLVLLTDIDGVYDADPRHHPDAKLLTAVDAVTPAMLAAAGEAGAHGTGGMRSKLAAAQLAADAGVMVHIGHARKVAIDACVLSDQVAGTTIAPHPEGRRSSLRRWLGMTRVDAGAITIDAGAQRALSAEGCSLLPAGITAVAGDFARGDTVRILAADGTEVARGMASLSAQELQRVTGQRMDEAEQTLGHALPKAAVHRDHLLLAD
jgi:glutamate 5-kinase